MKTFTTNFIDTAIPFELAVSAGQVPGYSKINKYGRADDIDIGETLTVWDGTGVGIKTAYVWPTSATIDRVSSSNAGDTQAVTIVGLDGNWNEVTQEVTLTGQTPKALTTALIRVYRMYGTSATDFAGIVYCFENGATTGGVPDDLTTVKAVINDGNNQTLMALYSVPAGCTAFLRFGYASLASNIATTSVVNFWVRPFGGVFRLTNTVSVASTGASFLPFNYWIPIPIAAKSDMYVTASSTANNVSVAAGFDIILSNA